MIFSKSSGIRQAKYWQRRKKICCGNSGSISPVKRRYCVWTSLLIGNFHDRLSFDLALMPIHSPYYGNNPPYWKADCQQLYFARVPRTVNSIIDILVELNCENLTRMKYHTRLGFTGYRHSAPPVVLWSDWSLLYIGALGCPDIRLSICFHIEDFEASQISILLC